MQRRVIISLHDVHPGSASVIERQRQALLDWGVRTASLLVVPYFHHGPGVEEDSSLCRKLVQRKAAGDELVLHGHFHDLEGQPPQMSDWFWRKFYTNGEAEFLSLEETSARARWRDGVAFFKRQNWNSSGFIAPAWLIHPMLIDLLPSLGFQYTVLHREIVIFGERPRRDSVPTLCWSTRALWRRGASLGWNACFFQRLRTLPVFRISLHPGDFEHPVIWRQIEKLIKSTLDLGYGPITYEQYATG